MCNKRSFF